MPGRRRKHFHGNLSKSVIEKFFVGPAEPDPDEELDFSGDEGPEQPEGAVAKRAKMDEQKKCGIYFDDGYDYMKHLKNVSDIQQSEMKELVVVDPSGACEVSRMYRGQVADGANNGQAEGGMGVLSSQLGADPDLDPEVLAALEEDFDFDDPDNQLEDDFLGIANQDQLPEGGMQPVKEKHQPPLKPDFAQGEGGEGDDEDFEGSDVDSNVMEVSDDDGEWTDDDEDDKEESSCCKKTSCSSVPRNKQQKLLDEQTETIMAREYTDDQIGALDLDELGGRVGFDSDLFKQSCTELKDNECITLKDILDKDRVRPNLPESWKYEEVLEDEDFDRKDEERARRHEQEKNTRPKKAEWDCVSILSTLSNTKNIPKTVSFPAPDAGKKKKRTISKSEGDPEEVSVAMRGLTLKEIEQQLRTEKLADAPSTYRPSDETLEERKDRKNAIKEHRKERRAEKKMNKLAFRSEMQKQNKMIQIQEMQEKVISLQIPN